MNNGFAKIYIMIEDSKSGKAFWEWMCKYKLRNVELKMPKDNNNNYILVEEVEKIKDGDGNIYIVLFDESFDNGQTIRYYDKLQKICYNADKSKRKANVYLIKDFYGLESVFLTFDKFIEWFQRRKPLSGEEIALLNHFNKSFRSCRNPLADSTMRLALRRMAQKNAKLNNSEEASRVLLDEVTRKHRGFRVGKNELGKCWLDDCCYDSHIDCGLDLTKAEKADELYVDTYIEKLFKESGILDVANLY